MPDVIIIRDPSGLLQFATLALAVLGVGACVLWMIRRIDHDRTK